MPTPSRISLGQPLDALAQRRCSLGERADRVVLCARLRGERVELGAGAGQRFEEAVGAFVAIGGKLGEALVDKRQAAIDFGDHALRRAVLLGNSAERPSMRAVGVVDIGRERFGGIGAGLADPRRGLRDKRARPRRLGIDPGADLLERRRGPVEQRIERARIGLLCLADFAAAAAIPARLDLRQACGQPLGRLADELVGVLASFGQFADLLPERRGFLAEFAADAADLLGNRARCLFRARQIFEQHGDVVARRFGGAVERLAMPPQLLAAAVELARDPAELAGGLVAELHQMLGDHRQLGAAVLRSAAESTSSSASRLRASLRMVIDRAGEALGFLAAGAAEDQPDEAEQRQRSGRDRDPLRDLRRR